MKISLTKRALNQYRSIKDYIAREWGENVAISFEVKTRNFLDLLEEFPEIGAIEFQDKHIRGFQLTKQVRVFYRIKEQRILILTFFDVRQSPSKKLQ